MNDQTPFIGRSMTRREDRRLLTGRGQYIADLDLPHMLHAVLVRSRRSSRRVMERPMKGVWSFMLDARLAQLGTSSIARHCEERRRVPRYFEKYCTRLSSEALVPVS